MFLSISECAKKYGVSTSTVRAWIRDGEVPGHDGPRGQIVDPDDVEQFLDELDAEAEADDEAEDEDEDDEAEDEDDEDEVCC